MPKFNNVTYQPKQQLVLVCDSTGIRTEHTRIPKGINSNTLREIQTKWAAIERAEEDARTLGEKPNVRKPTLELKAEVVSDKFGEGVTVKLLNEAEYIKSFNAPKKHDTSAKQPSKSSATGHTASVKQRHNRQQQPSA